MRAFSKGYTNRPSIQWTLEIVANAVGVGTVESRKIREKIVAFVFKIRRRV